MLQSMGWPQARQDLATEQLNNNKFLHNSKGLGSFNRERTFPTHHSKQLKMLEISSYPLLSLIPMRV